MDVDCPPAADHPVAFNVTLDNVDGFPLFSDKASDAKSTASKLVTSDEYYMTLEAEVNVNKFSWLEAVTNEEVEFILILDNSGSMNGSPWKQVQDAVVHMIEMTKDNPRISKKIMT